MSSSTYKLIIQKIADSDINFFSHDYTITSVHSNIRFVFNILQKKDITIPNKFIFFNDIFNGNLIKGCETEFMDCFYKIQKTYNVLNKFVFNYKYKKAKIVSDTDMFMNPLTINDKNVLCIFQDNSKYLFSITDLITIINTSLTNSHMFFSEPVPIKNPYNNIPFKKSDLYNIYLFIRYKTDLYPELYFKFFNCDFNISIFKHRNEYILREYTIQNHVYKSTDDILVSDITSMIKYYNNYCKKYNIQYKIIIDTDFPKEKLIKIFQPYLLLYFTCKYAFVTFIKEQNFVMFIRGMHKFHKFNPNFGRKIVKLQYRTASNFKRKICGKIYEFNDNHIKNLGNSYDNMKFLTDHLDYDNSIFDNVFHYYDTDEDVNDHANDQVNDDTNNIIQEGDDVMETENDESSDSDSDSVIELIAFNTTDNQNVDSDDENSVS